MTLKRGFPLTVEKVVRSRDSTVTRDHGETYSSVADVTPPLYHVCTMSVLYLSLPITTSVVLGIKLLLCLCLTLPVIYFLF